MPRIYLSDIADTWSVVESNNKLCVTITHEGVTRVALIDIDDIESPLPMTADLLRRALISASAAPPENDGWVMNNTSENPYSVTLYYTSFFNDFCFTLDFIE